jgi:hypothetical protein
VSIDDQEPESSNGVLALDHGPDRRWQLFVRVLTVGMIALFGVFVAIIAYWLIRPDPFAPLTFQTVRVIQVNEDGTIIVPQVAGYDAPSIYIDQRLPLSFSFCSSSHETFDAVGNSWIVDATHGTRYELNKNLLSTIRPGCFSPRVRVELPTDLKVDLEGFVGGPSNSPLSSPWYVEGELTPEREGGVTATWQSETFLIVAEREPRS